MRWSGCRIYLGAAVLTLSICGVQMAAPDVPPVPDAEFKTLVKQDADNIAASVKDGKPVRKTSDRAIKSDALMIAAYAQSRGENDLRDTALKVFAAAKAKNYAGVANLTAKLTAPAAKVPGMKLNLATTTDVDIEELMYQFKKKSVGGLDLENDIKANAKKATMTPDQAAALAQRVQIVSDFAKSVGPAGGFNNAKPQNQWDRFNKDMETAATALAAAAKAKKLGVNEFNKLDASCVACHNVFK